MNKEIVLKIGVKELSVVRKHLSEDISFGVNGSFGDGVKINRKELERAKIALRIIEESLGFF